MSRFHPNTQRVQKNADFDRTTTACAKDNVLCRPIQTFPVVLLKSVFVLTFRVFRYYFKTPAVNFVDPICLLAGAASRNGWPTVVGSIPLRLSFVNSCDLWAVSWELPLTINEALKWL